MKNRSRYKPYQINNLEYYRIPLSTKKNITSGFSQHELLYSLSKNLGAMVYYACPMLFDRCELYKQHPDMNLLRLADVECCPSAYSDNESHFIYFNDKIANPIWCSDPVEGVALTPEEMIKKFRDGFDNEKFRSSQIALLGELERPVKFENEETELRILDFVSDSLIFVKYCNNDC